ncbi:hypothetical protein [Vibrio penaeicida]|uniref:hypothetical protein n=1 Tax=Vibrio penaeicida TaxID=104609 RepID=UPI0011AB32BC|nr:hypothetical protein [Vibrio penaeicida]
MRKHFDFAEWVREQFPDAEFILDQDYFSKSKFDGGREPKINFLLHAAIDVYESYSKDIDITQMAHESMVCSSFSDHYDEDCHGSELGGYWTHDQFIIRSGIVASLGALEELERGVLRILYAAKDGVLYNYPTPRLQDFKYGSETWETVKRQANSVDRRRKLFKSFGVKSSVNEHWYSKLSEYRSLRHIFAHGVGAPEVRFQDFIYCQHYAYKNMRHIASEVNKAMGINL